MIRHHPDDALLMALAAGSIAHGPAVVVRAHVERCPSCLVKFREFEAVGGVLLERLEPAALPQQALERTLERINERQTQEAVVFTPNRLLADLPAGVPWPRSLKSSTIKPWLRLGPGVRWSRVNVPHQPANLHLLRVAAGKRLPVHGHHGGELSQVLHGAFTDGDERFEVGDFIEAADADHHRPVVTMASECICLVSVEGKVAFDRPLARLLGSLLGM